MDHTARWVIGLILGALGALMALVLVWHGEDHQRTLEHDRATVGELRELKREVELMRAQVNNVVQVQIRHMGSHAAQED